jgi:MvaI/BcnI restriction endonuclease family
VSDRHGDWLRSVEKRAGLGELDPQPYSGFDDLGHKAGTKLPNTFYVQAAVKKEEDRVFYKYEKVTMLQQFSFDGFLHAIEGGKVLVDFDARSGHNHGTKFRLRQECLPLLYREQKVVIH